LFERGGPAIIGVGLVVAGGGLVAVGGGLVAKLVADGGGRWCWC